MKKIFFLVNSDLVVYNFRLELIERLLQEKYEVWVLSPYGERIDRLVAIGCHYIPVNVSCHGLNPLADFRLFFRYLKLIRRIRPDVVLSYTIKPNLYGSFACRLLKTPCFPNITGLGMGLRKNFLLAWLIKQMYKITMAKNRCIFFQNHDDLNFFLNNHLLKCKHRLLVGSGVNLNHFRYETYPDSDANLIYVGRIMRDKGIGELLSVVPDLAQAVPDFHLDIVGNLAESRYLPTIQKLEKQGWVRYHGSQFDVRPFIRNANAIVLPSYHEGMSNVLLETSAMGRPVLASRIPGCAETFDEGVSGLGFESKNPQSLLQTLKKFLALPHVEKEAMGQAARRKVEKEFDRQLVVEAYMEELAGVGK